MGRPQQQFTEEQKLEIEQAFKKSEDKLEQTRLLILRNRGQGKSTQENMLNTNSTRDYVLYTISRYMRGGLAGVFKKKRTGHHWNIGFEQEAEMLKELEEEAEVWRTVDVLDIQKAYEDKVGRKVHNCVIYSMLKRHNWRRIFPRRYAAGKVTKDS